MSKPENWACWSWSDEKGVRYVGSGPFTDDGHPAARRWAARFDDESPLNLWLQGFIDEPPRKVCGGTIMTRTMSRDLAAIYREREKATILSAREPQGGGHARRVAHITGEDSFRTFRSVREAGRWAGINPSTVTRRCQNEKCREWLFLPDDSI